RNKLLRPHFHPFFIPFLSRSGTGPFFGEKTHFADEPLAENMGLSPSRGARGTVPRERLRREMME
ncbi:MAG: hypothetical protein K8R46_10255, partial [Pirellulales bacterium]|nr:hypothetical protein [Pirellulales bacterium]